MRTFKSHPPRHTRALTLTGKQKAKLKGIAHSLKPIIRIGKAGVQEPQINSIKRALHEHELIKIKFLDYKSHKEEITQKIATETASEIVDIIGNTAIMYWENLDKRRRKIKL